MSEIRSFRPFQKPSWTAVGGEGIDQRGRGVFYKTVTAVAFSPDGDAVMSVAEDGVLSVFGLDGKVVARHKLVDHRGLHDIAFSADGTLAACAGGDAKVWVVNWKTGEVVRTLEGLKYGASAVAIAGDKVVAGSSEGGMRVWRLDDGEQLAKAHNVAEKMAFSLDGRWLVSVGESLMRWDLSDLTSRPKEVDHDKARAVTALAFSMDGTLLTVGARGLIGWNVAQAEPVSEIEDPKIGGFALVQLHGTDELALASGGAYLRRYSLSSRTDVGGLPAVPESSAITTLAVSPDGKLLVCGTNKGELVGWPVEKLLESENPDDHVGQVGQAVVAPDGKLAVTLSGLEARIWDMESGKLLHVLPHERGGVSQVAWTGDSQRLMTATSEYLFKFWDAQSGSEIARHTRNNHRVRDIQLAGDGNAFWTQPLAGTIARWEPGEEPPQDLGTRAGVGSMAVHPSGKFVAASLELPPDRSSGARRRGLNRVLRIYDAENNEDIVTHEGAFSHMVWTADDELVTAEHRAVLKRWRFKDGALECVEKTTPLKREAIQRLVALRDGSVIAFSQSPPRLIRWSKGAQQLEIRQAHGSRYRDSTIADRVGVIAVVSDTAVTLIRAADELSEFGSIKNADILSAGLDAEGHRLILGDLYGRVGIVSLRKD